MTQATAIYRSIILEFERRRQSLGIPMEKLSDFAGLPERYWSKAIHPDTPSGRQAQWQTMQIMAEALFPHGFDLVIRARSGEFMSPDNLKAKLLRLTALHNPKTQREVMSEIALRVTKEARKRGRMKIPKWRRRQIARHAARAKAQKYNLLKRAGAG